MSKVFTVGTIWLLVLSLLSACTCFTIPCATRPTMAELQNSNEVDVPSSETQEPTAAIILPTERTPTETEIYEPSPTLSETESTVSTTTNSPREDSSMPNMGELIIDGRRLETAYSVAFTEHGAMLPFVAVLEALGAEILWENDHNAKIFFQKQEYMLDTAAAVMISETNHANCLIATPGSVMHHKLEDGIFVLDHITVRTVLMIMGVSAKIEVDYENCTVEIST